MELENIETVLPGVVTKVGDGVVDCKTCIRKVSTTGIVDIVNFAIPKIPLMKLGGANAEITFPTKAGDQVLLVALSRDSSMWKKGFPDDVTPESCDGLSLSDFVAVPFIASKKAEGAAKIRIDDDGGIQISNAGGGTIVMDGESGKVTINGHLEVTA